MNPRPCGPPKPFFPLPPPPACGVEGEGPSGVPARWSFSLGHAPPPSSSSQTGEVPPPPLVWVSPRQDCT